MSETAQRSTKAVRLANDVVNAIVLVAILLLLVFGCYALWDSRQVHSNASSKRYEVYKPTDENEGVSFQELQAINPETFSWLTVYGTHIDYPVVQGQSNLKYINTDAWGRHSLSGAIFLDRDCSKDFSDFPSIIYGHHMEKNTMFGEIGLFAQHEYFTSHRYGSLYYDAREHGLVFFAFVHADAYDSSIFRTNIIESEQQAYLNMLLQVATYTRDDVPVGVGDRIVLLSTCSSSSTNGRDILIGKITDETYDDPFKTENTDKPHLLLIDALSDLWAQAPLWVKAALVSLPFWLILLALVFTSNNEKRSQQERGATGDRGGN